MDIKLGSFRNLQSTLRGSNALQLGSNLYSSEDWFSNGFSYVRHIFSMKKQISGRFQYNIMATKNKARIFVTLSHIMGIQYHA